MDNDKRAKQPPIPDDLDNYLNADQKTTMSRMENFGWSLKFVRRPLFQDVIPVMFSPDGKQYGVLEQDGELNTQPDIQIRDIESLFQ